MKLEIKNLVKSYQDKKVLCGADYIFEKGKIYGILGRNGAGKTTFFNCITRDVVYESGEMYLLFENERNPLQFDDIGFVSASPVLPEFLTGYEFIHFFVQLHRENQSGTMKTVEEYFKLVHIEERDQHRLLKEYSYGMKNKIQLLCCLIKNPRVILLDEPLSSFDILVSHDIKELLIEMKSEHIILMSTHLMQLARDVCDEIVILKNGLLEKAEPEGRTESEFEAEVIRLLEENEGCSN